VIDALKVRMNGLDLRYGEAISTSKCAIARSINRQYPHLTHVRVTPRGISATDKSAGERYKFDTPRQAVRFILRFDAGADLQPISFTARLEEVARIQRSAPGEARQVRRVVCEADPAAKAEASMARRVKARSL